MPIYHSAKTNDNARVRVYGRRTLRSRCCTDRHRHRLPTAINCCRLDIGRTFINVNVCIYLRPLGSPGRPPARGVSIVRSRSAHRWDKGRPGSALRRNPTASRGPRANMEMHRRHIARPRCKRNATRFVPAECCSQTNGRFPACPMRDPDPYYMAHTHAAI